MSGFGNGMTYTFGPSETGNTPYFGTPDPSAVDPTMSGTGNGTDWAAVAKAIGAGAQQQQQQQSAIPNAQAGQSSAGQASSGAYQGSPAGINALAQMLMARVQALRQASNPRTAQPVNLQSQQRPAGLLGL